MINLCLFYSVIQVTVRSVAAMCCRILYTHPCGVKSGASSIGNSSRAVFYIAAYEVPIRDVRS